MYSVTYPFRVSLLQANNKWKYELNPLSCKHLYKYFQIMQCVLRTCQQRLTKVIGAFFYKTRTNGLKMYYKGLFSLTATRKFKVLLVSFFKLIAFDSLWSLIWIFENQCHVKICIWCKNNELGTALARQLWICITTLNLHNIFYLKITF